MCCRSRVKRKEGWREDVLGTLLIRGKEREEEDGLLMGREKEMHT